MTLQQYEERRQFLASQDVKGKRFDFKGQKPIKYIKIEVFEIEVQHRSFHWGTDWRTKQDKIEDWDKDFIREVAEACGIDVVTKKSEKINSSSYVSKTAVERLLPGGNKRHKEEEYEYDSQVRSETIILKDLLKCQNSRNKSKYEDELKQRLLQNEMSRNARSLASTGSEKRAIISILQIPKPSMDLIGNVWFCFQCIPNMENEEVRLGYLSDGNVASLVYSGVTEKDVTSTEPSIQFKIGEERANLKDHKALCKLTGLVLDRGTELDEYYSFMKGYLQLDQDGRVSEIINRLQSFENVPENVVNGNGEVRTAYLVQWGNN